MRRHSCCVVTYLAICLFCRIASGFDGHRVKQGPLTLTIEEIPTVMEYEAPQSVSVKLENSGSRSLEVLLELKNLVDEWRIVGRAQSRVPVSAQGQVSATFQIAAGRECHSAHYPVHV